MNLEELAVAAERLAHNSEADIQNADTRLAHIRATALAVESALLAKNLRLLADREALGTAVLDFPTH